MGSRSQEEEKERPYPSSQNAWQVHGGGRRQKHNQEECKCEYKVKINKKGGLCVAGLRIGSL